jgi:hypothetical protein
LTFNYNMPTFKPKNTKQIIINKNSNTTLDGKHKEIVDGFRNTMNVVIPSLKKEKKEFMEKLNKENITIEERLDIEDRINEINKEIKKLKQDEKNYFLDNSKYVFDYFENKKKISEGNNKTTLLNDFFNLKRDASSSEVDLKERTNIQKYLSNVDESFLDMNNFVFQTDICKICEKGELIPVEHEGLIVCNVCSYNTKYLVDNDKPIYKEPPKEVCFYVYKRINHFREILAQFQAKETTQIPDEVMENIKQQIKKERIKLTQITNKKAKDILKKLGYNKYYEHIPFIKDKLGIKPPIMTPQLEERLCNMFIDIQGPYAKYCPEDRVNFLNYYYTVYKLCELLDQKKFLPFFPMLKDREKRIEQDEIWKNICKDLDWEFIPTI